MKSCITDEEVKSIFLTDTTGDSLFAVRYVFRNTRIGGDENRVYEVYRHSFKDSLKLANDHYLNTGIYLARKVKNKKITFSKISKDDVYVIYCVDLVKYNLTNHKRYGLFIDKMEIVRRYHIPMDREEYCHYYEK